MPTVTPFLWFENQAEEAANFYVSLFPNSKVVSAARYGEGAPIPAGTVMTITFELNGQTIIALNGGPEFKFNESFSFYVNCETQREVDDLWNKLCKEGEEGQCGWLKDKYGLSWQIVPSRLGELLGSPDPVKSKKVMEAMLKMRKIDITVLQRAHDQ